MLSIVKLKEIILMGSFETIEIILMGSFETVPKS
jgi:hypothetical protein